MSKKLGAKHTDEELEALTVGCQGCEFWVRTISKKVNGHGLPSSHSFLPVVHCRSTNDLKQMNNPMFYRERSPNCPQESFGTCGDYIMAKKAQKKAEEVKK
ncbi:MAG: hypothetical protein R3B53_02150 [Candidatus Paceibacterota bacterium]